MERPILELNHISKTIGSLRILEDVSLTVRPGETVALIGSSGAGKTTLINLIAGILEPDAGEIRLDGTNAGSFRDRRAYARTVGVIRQQFDLIQQLPVIHNVLAGRLNHWSLLRSLASLVRPREKSLALRALERVGIRDKIDQITGDLSGGEQQRVALARLLVQAPRIILADEPVSSLDPARAAQIMGLMRRLTQEEGQTLVVSLHSTEYIQEYFSRVIALKGGCIFFDRPAHRVTEQDLAEVYKMEEMS